MKKIKGGCLCDQIRYESDAEPLLTVLCHCINCQKNSGTAYSTNVAIPKGEITLQGEPSIYVDSSDTGNRVSRFFCPNCGSALLSKSDGLDLTILKAGTLDDTSWLTPTMEIYCDSAQEWTKRNGELESHAKMLPV
jgi:hypothetical protein